jgi:GAF domain-containing protein
MKGKEIRMRRGAKPAKAKAPGVRNALKKQGTGGRELEKRLAEMQEQQTATAEILRVISRSQTDAQPVFDAIAQNVLRLCDATWSTVMRYDGELVHIVALDAPDVAEARRRNPWIESYPRPPARAGVIGKAILDRAPIHVPDVETDGHFSQTARQVALAGGSFAVLVVPLLGEGTVVGALSVARPKPGAFTDT